MYFPWSNFKKLGTLVYVSLSSTTTGLSGKNLEKRAHPMKVIMKLKLLGKIIGLKMRDILAL